MFGPGGDPNAPPAAPQEITLVPYNDAKDAPLFPVAQSVHSGQDHMTADAGGRTQWAFSDTRAALLGSGSGNVFGEEDDLRAAPDAIGSGGARTPGMPVPSTNASTSSLRDPRGEGGPAVPGTRQVDGEHIEMMPSRGVIR